MRRLNASQHWFSLRRAVTSDYSGEQDGTDICAASRFFRHSPSSDEKTATKKRSNPVFNAGIDMDTDPVNDIDPAIDAAIDAAVRAGTNGQSKKRKTIIHPIHVPFSFAQILSLPHLHPYTVTHFPLPVCFLYMPLPIHDFPHIITIFLLVCGKHFPANDTHSDKVNWFFGTTDGKVEKPLPEPNIRDPNALTVSENDAAGQVSADDFETLPDYNDDSDDDLTALPQLPSSTSHPDRASGSALARAIERNDPDVPLPLSPRLRRKGNTLSLSSETNGNEGRPIPSPGVEPKTFKSPSYSLFPNIGQSYANGSTYSLFSRAGRDSVNGSTVGLLGEYSHTETPYHLSSTPEPSRTKGGFTGMTRLKKSYVNLKSKSKLNTAFPHP